MTDYKPLSGRWCMRRALNSRALLSVSDVYAIRRRAALGEAIDTLAREHGVKPTTVRDVVARHSWMRLPPEPVYWKSEPSAFWSWWLTIWIFLSLCETRSSADQPAAMGTESLAC